MRKPALDLPPQLMACCIAAFVFIALGLGPAVIWLVLRAAAIASSYGPDVVDPTDAQPSTSTASSRARSTCRCKPRPNTSWSST